MFCNFVRNACNFFVYSGRLKFEEEEVVTFATGLMTQWQKLPNFNNYALQLEVVVPAGSPDGHGGQSLIQVVIFVME